MFKPIIVIMNPRLIPEVLACYKALPYPKVWMSFYTEREIMIMFPSILAEIKDKGFTHISMISDDALIEKEGVEEIYKYAVNTIFPNAAFSGWANIDSGPWSNISTGKLNWEHPPPWGKIKFFTIKEMDVLRENGAKLIRTYLTGMCFHTMHVDLWEEFPFQCYLPDRPASKRVEKGYSSDYHQCFRLQQAGVPMFCCTKSRLIHLRNNRSRREWKLWIGQKQSKVTWEV